MYLGHYLWIALIMLGILVSVTLFDTVSKRNKIKRQYKRLNDIEKEVIEKLKEIALVKRASEVNADEYKL